jgi:hypothetical protein
MDFFHHSYEDRTLIDDLSVNHQATSVANQRPHALGSLICTEAVGIQHVFLPIRFMPRQDIREIQKWYVLLSAN